MNYLYGYTVVSQLLQPFFGNNILDSSESKEDDLDILIRDIFKAIDTYYLDWQAYEVKQLILAYLLQKGITRDKR
jgi:hypothetical protein